MRGFLSVRFSGARPCVRAGRLCSVRIVGGDYVAGNLQQGGCDFAERRYGAFCPDGAGGGFGLFRRPYGGGHGFQSLRGGFEEGYSGGGAVPIASAVWNWTVQKDGSETINRDEFCQVITLLSSDSSVYLKEGRNAAALTPESANLFPDNY